jgi:hypothetical protein
MTKFELNINGEATSVIINTLVQRRYAERMGLKFVNDTIKSLQLSDEEQTDGEVQMSYETIDKYVIMIHCGIAEACRQNGTPFTVEVDDCYAIFDDNEQMQKVITGLFGTLPVAEETVGEESGNVQSPEMPG